MSASPISISLITPTYNERENIALLAKEVFSVLDGNTEIDLELIVVDDGSADKPFQVISTAVTPVAITPFPVFTALRPVGASSLVGESGERKSENCE